MLGLGSNHHGGAGGTSVIETLQELVGQDLADERCLVNPFDWRVEFRDNFHVWRRIGHSRRALVEPQRQTVRCTTFSTKTTDHIGGIKLRKTAHRVETQSNQHARELGTVKHTNGQWRQERC
jgi:hypothetical protein